MRVKVDRLVATEEEIQIPEVCPSCGRDFQGQSEGDDAGTFPLIELQQVLSEQDCRIVRTQEGDFIENGDSYENDTECAFTTGYKCGDCGFILADTGATITIEASS